MAFAARLIESEAPAPRVGWTPRTAEVSPALARMHERLRCARAPGERGMLPVPAVSARADGFREEGGRKFGLPDPRSEAIAAMDGGTVTIERSSVSAEAPAHLRRSVERFVRLRGRSGRTYVFSRIEARHVSLYRNGIFATAPAGGERATVIGDIAPILSNALADDLLYVHLLCEEEGDREAVVADLG